MAVLRRENSVKKLFIFLLRLLPLQKMIVFESHPDFSDNSFALYQELIRRGIHKKYRIYWMRTFREGKEPELPENVYTFQNDARTPGEVLKRAYVLNCARFIIDCNTFLPKRRKKQVRIHLGHGMPVKIDLEYSRKFGDCDKYVVQSEFWKSIYTEQIHVPEETLCYMEYPRNDVLVEPVSCDRWKDSVRNYDQVIIWMPTYRQHRLHMERAMKNEYPYGMPCIHNEEEISRFHEFLREKNILVLFRPHPVQELSMIKNCGFSHIVIADDGYLDKFGITLYELLGNTNGLITDYSSVYFDYLLTDKPVALTIEDREEYFRHFTPAFPDYKRYIKGYYVESFEELLGFIEEMAEGKDSAGEERKEAKKLFHADTEGKSAFRIAELLVSEYQM